MLNTDLPSKVVIASHIFRKKNEDFCELLLQFVDINDLRNGLLLFKPIEKAFDEYDLSFIFNSQNEEFELKLFNPHMQHLPLVNKLERTVFQELLVGVELAENWENSNEPIYIPNTTFDIRTTFGDLIGRPLIFKSTHRPYKKCLYFQASWARIMAIEKGWITVEYDFEDFSSEGMNVNDKMARFRKSMLE